MKLKKIYSLREDVSNGVPEPLPEKPKQGLGRFFRGRQAGEGDTSDGVPQALPAGLRNGSPPPVGSPIATDDTRPNSIGQDQTIPVQRTNAGGTGGPPKGSGPFSRAPNAPAEEPLPDLPLESASIRGLYGMHVPSPLGRPAGLAELYRVDEMPRPQGSYGPAVMAMLKWAQSQGSREFNTRDLFNAWRAAGAQAHQDDKKAYTSFQNIYRRFIDPRGRGTPEQPLVITQGGFRGRGGTAVFRWGSVRASQSPTNRPTAGATSFDDMELGPAGGPGMHEPEQEIPDQGEPEQDQEFDQEQEPEEEPEEEPSEADLDWVPATGDPEDRGVEGAMARLGQADPDKLQELLLAAYEAKDTDDAGFKAFQIFGKGQPHTRDAIRIAKQVALNLGRPDMDKG